MPFWVIHSLTGCIRESSHLMQVFYFGDRWRRLSHWIISDTIGHMWKISGCVLQLTGEHRPQRAEVMKLERRRGRKTWYQWKFQSMTLTINKIRMHKGGNVTLSWKCGALNIAKSLFCVRQRLFFLVLIYSWGMFSQRCVNKQKMWLGYKASTTPAFRHQQ